MTIHHPCQQLLPLNLPLSPAGTPLLSQGLTQPARRRAPNLVLVPRQEELELPPARPAWACPRAKAAAD